MRYKLSLAQRRHLTLREQRERDEWEEAYRRAVRRETFMHYTVDAIVCGTTRLVSNSLPPRSNHTSSQRGGPPGTLSEGTVGVSGPPLAVGGEVAETGGCPVPPLHATTATARTRHASTSAQRPTLLTAEG